MLSREPGVLKALMPRVFVPASYSLFGPKKNCGVMGVIRGSAALLGFTRCGAPELFQPIGELPLYCPAAFATPCSPTAEFMYMPAATE